MYHPSQNIKPQLGFTLIEILVAIAIFASLSIAAYQVLNQVQRSNQISQQRLAELTRFQKAWAMIDSDFRQVATRQFRHNGDESSKQLIISGKGFLNSEDEGIIFTRLGWINPMQQFARGDVVKVAYRIENQKLIRMWWRHPDTVMAEPAIERVLLDNVQRLEFSFYNGERWLNEWSVELKLPQALRIALESERWGVIERIYLTNHSEQIKTEEVTK